MDPADLDDAVDPVDAWQETYERVATLVAGLTPEQLGTTVPACPDWTVQDLVSHMVGLGADVVGGDEPDDHNDEWTGAQVAARRGRSAPELLTEWRIVSGRLVAWMRDNGARPLGDAVIHEQDIRGALDLPGGRDGSGLPIIRDRMADRFGQAAGDLPPIRLQGETWSYETGPDAEVVVEASDHDLFRALTSRRTAEQLRSWTTRGDVEPYLDAFAGLGPLPDEPVV